VSFGPGSDGVVATWVRDLGLPGLVDIHVHFLPQRVMRKVWAFFDDAERHYGTAWPVWYRETEERRLDILRKLGVEQFAPLVYPHKPGMAKWLNEWAREFAAREPGAVPTATVYPEPDAAEYVEQALRAGVRCVKVHVQVGAFDPRDPQLEAVWGMLTDAGIPVVVHCGHGPVRGEFTGLDVFAEVLAEHPRLTAVLAHAGMPEFGAALDLLDRFPNTYLDTTMVGTPFAERLSPLPPDWVARLADVPHRVALGTDFPNIPYPYATQLRAIAQWAAADERLGEQFLRAVLYETPKALLNDARGR